MKAKFIRGKEPKDAIDIGIERSDNPNNLANEKSLHIDKTNEDIINEIMEQLNELHQVMDYSLNPSQFDNPQPERHSMSPHIANRIHSIENEMEALIKLLKSIKR